MRLKRLFATATAAALLVCPALAAAQPAATTPDTTAPPAAAAPAKTLPPSPGLTPGANIYDTLKASPEFTQLVKAIDETGLAPVLQQYPNPQTQVKGLTFFAPTDDALNALPPDTLAKLMAANDTAANQLQQILKFHIITSEVDSTKIRGAKGEVPTIETSQVLLDGSDPNDLMVGGADIIQADVRTTNGGIINVIDKVLIPPDSPYYTAPAPAAAPAASATTAAPTP